MAAAAAGDPSSPSLSPRASLATRHPRPLVNGTEPEGPAADVPPSPSSPSPTVAIVDLEISDRSPLEVHAEDAFRDAAQGRKQAWKRSESVSVKAGGTVMVGSWPALSETAKPSSLKSSSSDALKSLSEAPLSAPAGTAISTPSPKPNSNPSLSRNHTTPVHQKSMKRGGGNNISSGGAAGDDGLTLPSPSPTSSPMANSEKRTPSEISFSPRDQITRKNTNWDRGNTLGRSVLHADDGSDLRSYGGYRRWNNGGGAGSHNNYSNHRNVERGAYDGYHRNAGGTDVRMQPRNARLLRPPTSPVAPPFLGPSQVGPFGNPMVFRDVPSPIFYIATQPPPGGVPFVPHPAVPPQMFIPTIDPHRSNLLKQIDYYFSAENLCRDVYLRQNMDEEGWVPVSLIAGFNRVKQLTNSVEFVLETLQLSRIIEVQGDKIRKRRDWMNWVLSPTDKQSANASSQLPTSPNFNNLAACQGIGYTYHNSMRLPNPSELLLSRSASGNLSNQIQVPANHNWDANGQVTIADSDKIKPGRSLLRSDTF